MNLDRMMARVAGLLFLLAMVAYAGGDALVAPLLPVTEAAGGATEEPVRAWYGLLLMFLNSVAVAAIPLLLFPAVRRHSRPVAFIYLGARWLEAVLLLVGIVMFASVLNSTLPTAQALRTAEACYQLAMFALGVGSVALCRLLLRARLLPAWLAWWGLAGYGLLAIGSVGALAGWDQSLALSIPGGLFELVLAVWLMTKGLALHPYGTAGDRRVSA